MTGTDECAASPSTVSCWKTRSTSASTYWLIGAGEVGERLAPAEADLVAGQEQARAAELGDAASKLTRVRSDGFSKTSADHAAGERVRRDAPRVRRLRAARPPRAGADSSSAVRSIRLRKCRMVESSKS